LDGYEYQNAEITTL